MPEFVDLFIGEVRRKRDQMKLKLEKGFVSAFDEDFKNLLVENWHHLPEEQTNLAEKVCLAAVDGSRGLRDYANGSRLFVVRGLAVTNAGEQFRKLEAEIFMSQESEVDIERYIRQKTESIELAAASEVVSHLKGSKKFVLVDGSLHGRMFHLLRDSPVEGDREFILRYMEKYACFLEECRKENVVPVGVSKDSRAYFLRNLFLDKILSVELRKLAPSLREEEIRELENCAMLVRDTPGICFQRLSRLRDKYGSKLDRLREMMLEYLRARTDFQLVMNFAPDSGYCSPIELSTDSHFRRDLRSLKTDPDNYVKRHFRKALIEDASQESQFVASANKIVRKILALPTTVSFHLLLDKRSTPLRVDIPSWVIGLDGTLNNLDPENRLVHLNGDVSKVIDEVVRLLRSAYAGLTNYNVWLKRVDDRVKLRRVDMDTIYERLLERELGVTLIHTRGYRRVKFP